MSIQQQVWINQQALDQALGLSIELGPNNYIDILHTEYYYSNLENTNSDTLDKTYLQPPKIILANTSKAHFQSTKPNYCILHMESNNLHYPLEKSVYYDRLWNYILTALP